MTNPQLVTPAWMLVGLTRSVPGVLRLQNGRIAFRTEKEDAAFDAPLGSVTDVKFPFYYFNGGVKLAVDGKPYRFSFLKPDAGADVPDHLLEGVDGPSTRSRFADAVGILAADFEAGGFQRGRKAGKAWKAALAAAAGESRPPHA